MCGARFYNRSQQVDIVFTDEADVAFSELLSDDNIDGIASPYKYGLNQFRRPTGNFGEF